VPDWLHRFLRPREGWLSLFLLFVMLLSVGWSVQSANWIDQADFLVPVALWGMLAGTLLALLPISVLATLPLGALLGTGVVLWAVGGEYFPELGQLGRLFALREDGLRWTKIISQGGFAPEMTPYAIGLGVILWTVSVMAAYTMYRHHRVLDAIVLVGAALITNLSATIAERLFGYLVLFCLAALMLWLRSALITREEGWQVRRVNENVEVPISIMRSGLTFIAGSIALAWILTTVAVAAPLTAAWRNMDVVWNGVRDRLDGVFGSLTNPESRITGTDFGAGFTVRGDWVSDDTPIMTVAAKGAYYMRTVTYDLYTGHGWQRSDGAERSVQAGDRIFNGYTPERPLTAEGFKRETITVQLQGDVGRNIFVPGYPTVIYAPVVIHESSGQPVLGGIDSASAIQPGQAYQVTALISAVTEAQLVSSGTAYPAEITATYLSTPGLTTEVAALANQLADAAPNDPYHRAKAIADYLRTDPSFHYSTSVEPPDPDRDLVDQFLFGQNRRVGYCEYFASAMVLMARSIGIPARMAVGYAPGEAVEKGVYQYRAANAHAWAELYFPGYGWQTFEATKSIDAVVRPRGEGTNPPPVTTPVGGVDGGQIDEGTGDVNSFSSYQPISGGRIVDQQGNAVPTDESARGGNLLVIGVIGLAALAFIWTRMRRRRQSMRFLTPGDRQWMRLAWAGDRAGVSQSPSETFYEYAGWLEDQLPTRRGEIRTIADGKVWQAYSGRSMNPTMIERVEAAWQRLRRPLVWLAVRRRVNAILPKRRR
jgi:transglutaminase-like putative cysteine protease